jgi:hypothetical protein
MLDTIAQVTTIVASLGLIIAIVSLAREIRTQNLQSLFYLHQYLAQDEFSEARRLVRTHLFSRPYEKWSEGDRAQASKVCASYDQAGILIEAGILASDARDLFLRSSWGESICDQYEALGGFLSSRQTPKKTGAEFFHHFTSLYQRASAYHRPTGGANG